MLWIIWLLQYVEGSFWQVMNTEWLLRYWIICSFVRWIIRVVLLGTFVQFFQLLYGRCWNSWDSNYFWLFCCRLSFRETFSYVVKPICEPAFWCCCFVFELKWKLWKFLVYFWIIFWTRWIFLILRNFDKNFEKNWQKFWQKFWKIFLQKFN